MRNPLPNGFLPQFIDFFVSGSQTAGFIFARKCRKNEKRPLTWGFDEKRNFEVTSV